MNYKNRIRNLEKKYSETNIAYDEILNTESIRKINQNYNQNQQKRRVDAILNNVRNKESIKKEVHDITKNVCLKDLCKNCKEELIISCIILYVQRTRNPQYRIDRTGLWSKYEITWLKYSLIVERLLHWTRENKTYIKNDEMVDNEDFVRW